SADLADHDHGIGLGIVIEQLQYIDVLQPVYRVAADADGAGLTEPEFGQLCDRLVRERAGTGDDTDAALAVDVPGHDADLQFFRRDDTGTVGTEQDRLALLFAHAVAHLDHVAHRNAFGNTNDEVEISFNRLPDGRRGTGRRHVDHRN